jgi:hypothetical protein
VDLWPGLLEAKATAMPSCGQEQVWDSLQSAGIVVLFGSTQILHWI